MIENNRINPVFVCSKYFAIICRKGYKVVSAALVISSLDSQTEICMKIFAILCSLRFSEWNEKHERQHPWYFEEDSAP